MTGPEQARQDLAEVLSEGRVEMSDALRRMSELGHPAGRVDRARRALEVETIRTGPPGSKQVFFWELPDSCPTCMRPFSPDAAPPASPWGAYQSGQGDYWSSERPPIDPPSRPPELQSTPPPPRDYGPPRCSVCHRASAVEPKSACPYSRPGGQRCVGTVE